MAKLVNFLNFKFIPMDQVWGVTAIVINDLDYSTNFIFSLKSSLVLLIYILAALVGLALLNFVILRNVRPLRRVIAHTRRFLYYNLPIRFVLQTFLCFSLAAMYNVKNIEF